MFSNFRKRLEDGLDSIEQLATQQMTPRAGSFDQSPDRRRTSGSIDGNIPAAAAPPSQLAESALNNLRKSLSVQRSLAAAEQPQSRKSQDANANGQGGTQRSTSATRTATKTMTLEDRLKAKFAIGDLSASTSAAGSRASSPLPPAESDADHAPAHAPLLASSNSDQIDPANISLPLSPDLSTAVTLPSISIVVPPPLHTETPPPPEDIPTFVESVMASPETIKPPILDLPTEDALQPSTATLEESAPPLTESEAEIKPTRHPSRPTSLSTFPSDELDTDKLRERLKLVEERFSDVSRSFKRLQAEKVAADKVLRELTPIEGIADAEGLQEHLRNMALKTEMSSEEIKRLQGLIRQHDGRISELRDTHKLESASQSSQIDVLKKQVSEAEILLSATSTTITAKQSLVDKLTSDLHEEEDKKSKAISLLKTVRTKLVKAEKDKEDLGRERDDMRLERDASRGETTALRDQMDRMKSEREIQLAGLRAQYEREVAGLKERLEKEAMGKKAQFELDAITTKAAHAKELAANRSRITQLEITVRTLSGEKDALFHELQTRQAELESAQSHMETLTNRAGELQYQLREANDRVAFLSEEVDAHRGADLDMLHQHGSGRESPEPPESGLARLLSEAEARYEMRLADLRDKLRAMERERNGSEEEWSRNLNERAREVERLKKVLGDKEAEWLGRLKGWEESETRIRELAREVAKGSVEREELVRAREALEREVEKMKDVEGSRAEERAEALVRIGALERTVEEYKARDAQLKSNNKTLREELRKVQSSAALLERQRNPGVGYWSSSNATSSRTPLSEVPPSSPYMNGNSNGSRVLSPVRVGSPALSDTRASESSENRNVDDREEAVNLEYLRNVVLQFLENEKMRPDLVRVLSIILRFTPQETRRLLAKVG